jgi:hypothetical protein
MAYPLNRPSCPANVQYMHLAERINLLAPTTALTAHFASQSCDNGPPPTVGKADVLFTALAQKTAFYKSFNILDNSGL